MLIPLLCLLICLGGCQLGKDKLPSEMDPKKLPDGRAFKDEFTRQFLQSTEEIMPGYYPFLAKNGKYEMAFPREGITDDTSYRSKTNFESIHFTDWEEGKDSSAMVDVRFYSYYTAGENVEIMQETLESNIKLPLEFEKVPGENETYYIAPFKKELDEDIRREKYGYGAYIQKESEAGGIFVIYSRYCEANCDEIREDDMQEAYDFILSIQFLEEVDEKEDP